MGVVEIQQALRAVAAGIARPRDAAARVWDLRGDSAAHVALKTRILEACIARGAFLLYGEPLEDPALRASIEVLGEDRHRLGPGVPVEALSGWLYLGNWQITWPACPPCTLDVARTAPDEICRFLEEQGLSLLVDSFHDDTDWVVALS